MEYIAHRINTVAALKEIPEEYGVELDLRDFGNRIILEHEPFKDGEDFEEYLKYYHHGTMILNIKSERIEHRVLELIQRHGIKKYFFLDSSFSMIELLTRSGEKNLALRLSEYECLETILNFKGKADWVWVDCFTKFPISHKEYQILRDNGFKLCFVSPELQSQKEKLVGYKEYMKKEGMVFDAICTKSNNIEQWRLF